MVAYRAVLFTNITCRKRARKIKQRFYLKAYRNHVRTFKLDWLNFKTKDSRTNFEFVVVQQPTA